VNAVPVTNQSESKQKKRDQQQTGGFRSIDSMAMMVLLMIVVVFWGEHADILALPGRTRSPFMGLRS
jgi:hypothetical protein